MLQINILDQFGHDDVSVTTLDRLSYAEFGWPDPNPAFAAVKFRNVAMIPLRLKNGGAETITGPSVSANPEMFLMSPNFPANPILKECVRLTVMTDRDDVLKETTVSVPFYNLVKDGVVRIEPGEYLSCDKFCLLDKSGVMNANPSQKPISDRRMNYLFFEFDWQGRIPGGYANLITPARFYTYQLRHSQNLDRP